MAFPAFLAVVLTAVINWFFLRALFPLMRRILLDHPNERSSHISPVPRGGGISFVIISLLAGFKAWFFRSDLQLIASPIYAIPLIVLPLSVVGLLDDRHNLPATLRYCVHLATGLLIVLSSPLYNSSFAYLPLSIFLVILVTAVINFTNFMDGLDGLVAGCMALAIATTAIQLSAPLFVWAIVGSVLGFLFLNWSPAKVFMGDVGSTFLGGVFAGLVLQASSITESFALLLVATPLFGDAFVCVLRRLLAGQQVLQAHRLHLFQRLHQAGWSHARVSFAYISATGLLAVAMLLGGWPWVLGFAVVVVLLGVWLDQRVAMPFAAASQR